MLDNVKQHFNAEQNIKYGIILNHLNLAYNTVLILGAEREQELIELVTLTMGNSIAYQQKSGQKLKPNVKMF